MSTAIRFAERMSRLGTEGAFEVLDGMAGKLHDHLVEVLEVMRVASADGHEAAARGGPRQARGATPARRKAVVGVRSSNRSRSVIP